MQWRDTGFLLSVRGHGETSAIIDVLTAEHGRHAGVVKGGTSRKLKPVLQPGADLALEWQARLEEHMGSFRVEPERSRAGLVMGDRLALEGLNALLSMASFALPEREPVQEIHAATVALADRLGQAGWSRDYARWELALLAVLGFRLDLSTCAATGTDADLIYVSPKSGRAVCRAAGEAYKDRLLPLPAFLIGGNGGTAQEALRLTEYFLRHRVAPSLGRESLPAARERYVALVARREED